MEITMKQCTMDDLFSLRELSYKTYDGTFGPMNSPDVIKSYLEKSFDLDKLRNELVNTYSRFYFLYAGKELAGYLKLNEFEAQTDINDPQSLEIERIYVAKEFQGRGLGRTLMNMAIAVGNDLGKSYLWLGVWEKNEKGIEFYKKQGFYVIGKHPFYMGQEEQTDYIFRKDLLITGEVL